MLRFLFHLRHRTAGVALAAAMAATAAAATAGAEDKEPQSTEFVLWVYDVRISLPMPSWLPAEATADQAMGSSEFDRKHEGREFRFQQVPKGQTFEDWTTLYSIYGLRVAEGQELSLDRFMLASTQIYWEVCGKENYVGEILSAAPVKSVEAPGADAPAAKTALIVCQRMANAPTVAGFSADKGAVILFRVVDAGSTKILVYQEWRGGVFDNDDPSTWPVTQDTLDEMIARFDTIGIAPAQP